jgi:hypothetical protein
MSALAHPGVGAHDGLDVEEGAHRPVQLDVLVERDKVAWDADAVELGSVGEASAACVRRGTGLAVSGDGPAGPRGSRYSRPLAFGR